ncbi:type II CRISPR RNA-guided endonuclease Cas9 [Lactobacillus sp. ESL0785]|uniref:type II CRISPR RNA-guided endonuclease Cas9 n=1 Tax=Lactobacillus sp. ESL0785 TaxID=2983232 RepID=UPI0023F789A6|nr:type II CRISPR RNA-guided endonuclease Cas9 [Lactobacillus sp. ESL0785]WEV71130.1 type II CRISPR RNA-guided endonuclease Cas9 [Lactobacillus sp. ESL0785]
MTKVKNDYIIGLDIGTNSCGWVATDKKNNILHLQGKTALGSHLFDEGKTAADRRGFRTTRRRLNRRKWRLKLLEEIFDQQLAKVDPYFLARMRDSWVSPLDKDRKKYCAIIFPTPKEDQKFYCKYPTIYHLRHALMTEDKKFDLRLVYLTIHHIVKYRGNFLQDTSVKSFDASKIAVGPMLEVLNACYKELALDDQEVIQFKNKSSQEIEKIIRSKTSYKADKVKKISQLMPNSTDKLTKSVAKQIANAIMGYKAQFETILLKEIDKNDKKAWEFKLSDSDADEKLAELLPDFDENEQTIVAEIHKLFSAIILSTIVDEGKTLSESMIAKYEQHRSDYQLLKQVIDSQTDKEKTQKLRLAYDLYVNNRHGKLLDAKEKLKTNILNREDFYKIIEANLDNSPAAQKIEQEIKRDEFMPKQRTSANGVIPNQLHQLELDKIIAKQSKYYQFLAEVNPVKEHQDQAPYKLDELVRFRVPYYVGPMITADDQKNTSSKNFAWMVRREAGRITPWNFDQKVNRMESANKFIKRMTTKDTYLLGEDVLPANSLLFQKFTVLNELNNIRINGKKISPDLKQELYNNLFKKQKTITAKRLVDYIKQNKQLTTVEIKGLADPTKFNSSLATYNCLRNKKVFAKQLDDPSYQNDFEKIIEWSTIFEDKKIYQEKLKELDWLTAEQFETISTWRFQGWGALSRKLLIGLHDTSGQNIMEQLWDSKNNFMQIVTQPDFKNLIEKENEQVAKENDVEDILADAYTSPANKKAIRQVIRVVDDIAKAAGGKAPAQFAIEFARDADKNPKLSQQRGNKLLKVYQDTAKELVDQNLTESLKNAKDSRQLVKDKYFLYFMQGGRDAYTGQKINIDEITSGYQIDHILPQAFIKDDSLDNRVLTKSKLNSEKSNDVPYKHFGMKVVHDLGITVSEMWKRWQKVGLINKYKLRNLLLDPEHLNKYEKAGFIKRQLVETSQIIKLVSIILQNKYPNSEIIVVKASYNHALRKRLNLYKSREVNDYHHAIDAYLSTVCGNFLYQVYPKLQPFFVYGKYKKFSSNPDLEKDIIRSTRTFNFIWPLLRKDKPDEPAPEEIYEFKTDKVVFHKHADIFYKLRKAYNYKYMLVSRQTSTQDEAMFKMTIFPRSDRDTKTTRSLIPKAKGLNPDIYGGYSNNADAYMAIVRIDKAKDTVYKVVGVPMRALGDLKKAEEEGKYNQVLYKILKLSILLDKKGRVKKRIKDFTIIKGRVPYKQLVQDGAKKFMLGSSTYMYNAKQLTLSPEVMRIVTGNFAVEEDRNEALLNAYDEILKKVDDFLPLYDINKFREKLHDGKNKFAALKVDEKQSTLTEILNGLHDNPVMGNLKNIGFSTSFGQMQAPSGITLSANAKLIFQSPTGLFEKRIKIKDL